MSLLPGWGGQRSRSGPGGFSGPGGPASGGGRGLGKVTVLVLASMAGLLVIGLLAAPMLMFAGSGLEYESGTACSAGQGGSAGQPAPSPAAGDSIPASYLALFRATGKKYGIPWVILAGIGKVESDDGQTTLPGVHSGANAFGAAGPMQIGIGGAAGNTWGGAPVHPASERVNGVATDANGDGIASVYEPADAIAGAAKYLLEHGVLDNVSAAIFAYNHLESYVQTVLFWAGSYANGGFTVSPVTLDAAPECVPGVGQTANSAVASAIAFAEEQLGKPYQWGGTGPDSFDCSGLVMEAYRSAGIDVPRTSQQQWAWGPRVSPGNVQPGDLVFFVGADGTVAAPGHVGLVIGGGMMIEAYATGFPIRVAPYGGRDPVGFTRPWTHPGVNLTAAQNRATTN
jgi:cell wall-associated NlpC family hydrolase